MGRSEPRQKTNRVEPPSSPFGGEKWQIPEDTREYNVKVTLYNPAYDLDVGSPIFVKDAAVIAPNERKAVEYALQKLAISWQGSDGARGAYGAGPNAYLIFDPASTTHVLSWGCDEIGAKAVAEMLSARHCFPVVCIEKIPLLKK